MRDMSNYSKEHWDEDTRRFAEEWGEVLCKGILKMVDGVYDEDDEDIVRLREKYGEEFFDKFGKIIAGNLEGGAVWRFLYFFDEKLNFYTGDLYNEFKKLAKKKGWLKKGKEIPGTPYRKFDFIDKLEQYEFYDVLGIGGFGIVYLIYWESCNLFALKTFRDEYLEDDEARERFKKEAKTWIDLEEHPYIVRARWIEILSDRPYIVVDYIAPNEDGLNTLDGYLKHRPPDLEQSLRWGIQFCHGMEYAYSKGIRAHRDIKPANIMIDQNKVLKITDFGLAGVIGQTRISGTKLGFHNGKIGLSCQTMEGRGFGTPTHMPPEQFTNAAACDEKSDIYSFGVVLYQMATGGNLPFLPNLPINNANEEQRRFWQDIHRLHCQAAVPKLSSPLFPIIQRCLEKKSNRRYQSFEELRADLEPILKRLAGDVVLSPRYTAPTIIDLRSKAESLEKLGDYLGAINCYDRMIEIAPRDSLARTMKGHCLAKLGKDIAAIACYDKALNIDPRAFAWEAWYMKGVLLHKMNKYQEALYCYEKMLEISPRDTDAWIGKGNALYDMGEYQAALEAYENFIKFAPDHDVDRVTKIRGFIEDLKAWLREMGSENQQKGQSGKDNSFWKRLFG